MLFLLLLCAFAMVLPSPGNGQEGYNYQTPAISFNVEESASNSGTKNVTQESTSHARMENVTQESTSHTGLTNLTQGFLTLPCPTGQQGPNCEAPSYTGLTNLTQDTFSLPCPTGRHGTNCELSRLDTILLSPAESCPPGGTGPNSIGPFSCPVGTIGIPPICLPIPICPYICNSQTTPPPEYIPPTDLDLKISNSNHLRQQYIPPAPPPPPTAAPTQPTPPTAPPTPPPPTTTLRPNIPTE